MAKILFIFLFIFSPIFVYGSTAGDFTVNQQSSYDVPPGTANLLILDLTLPSSQLKSIKVINAGTLQQREVFLLSVYEDGSSPGWDGDEVEKVRVSSSPFFDADIIGDFSKQRIFVTINVTSTAASGRTIEPELGIKSMVFSGAGFNGPTDKKITGFERVIRAGVSAASVPLSPLVKKGEAISTSTIRWYFTDLSDNEFGFKIIDDKLKTAATGLKNISYLDETGLEPNTEYSSRKIAAFNDRGQSTASDISVFPAVKTLEEATPPVTEEVRPPEEVGLQQIEPVPVPAPVQELKDKIQEIQLKIIELLGQLIQLLQEQSSKAQASLFGAFETITDWLESLSR